MYIALPLLYTCTCFCVCFRGPVYLVSGSVRWRRHILPAYCFLPAPWQAPLRFHTHDRQREHHFKWQLIRSCLHFVSHYPHRFFSTLLWWAMLKFDMCDWQCEDHFKWQLLRRCLHFVSLYTCWMIIGYIVVAYWFFFTLLWQVMLWWQAMFRFDMHGWRSFSNDNY